MTIFDYAVLLIVGVSVVLSVVRGFVREVLALAAWLIAFVAASLLSGVVAAWSMTGPTRQKVEVDNAESARMRVGAPRGA